MKTFLLVLMAIMLLTCSNEPETYTVEIIDGVRHVHNIGSKWGDDQKMELEFVRKIGEIEGNDENCQFYNPTDITLDKDGNYYILDSGNHRVVMYDKDLKFIRSFGNKGQGPGEFSSPVNIHVNSEGEIFVNDSRNRCITVFDNLGEFKKTIKGDYRPLNIKVLKSGGFVIYDISRGRVDDIGRGLVTIYSKEGEQIRGIGKRKTYESPIMNVQGNVVTTEVDAEDNIYVTYIVRNRIDKYSVDGKFLMQISRELPYEEEVLSPEVRMVNNFSYGIQVDGKERIWVGTHKDEKLNLWLEVYNKEGILLSRIDHEYYKYGSIFRIFGDRLFIIESDDEMAVFEYRIVVK